MLYKSTRGGENGVSFEEALINGYAKDGGLYVPESLPKDIPWHAWRGLTLPEILEQLLPFFIQDAEQIQIKEMLRKAYGQFDFPEGLCVKELEAEKLWVAELFHGPTRSFKDYSLIFLGYLLEYYSLKRNEKRTMLVATSGDTGSAAMTGIANKENLDIVVLYPHNRISFVQLRQMATIPAANVHLVGGYRRRFVLDVDGDSDELDEVLLPQYSDPDLTAVKLGCINSINIGRVVVQMAHWFALYFHSTKSNDQLATIAVPTGACGNLMGGVFAQAVGLPIKILATTGPNDIVHRLLQTGSFSKTVVEPSYASAMDIQVPYNVERLFFVFSNGDCTLVSSLMKQFQETGSVQVPTNIYSKIKASMSSHRVDNSGILSAIQRIKKDFDYVVCPHTATSCAYALDHPSIRPLVIIATAAPAKFADTMETAKVGFQEDSDPIVVELRKRPEVKHPFWSREERPQWPTLLKKLILSFN